MRPIDADALFDELLRAWGDTIDAGEANAFMEMVNNAPTIASSTNDPLTQEELWEMKGKPVWVERSDDDSRWALIRFVNKYGVNTYGCGFLSFEDALINWWAYRRKPEERPK